MQLHRAVHDVQVGAHVVQRLRAALDVAGAVFQVDVGKGQLWQVDRHVRQDAAVRAFPLAAGRGFGALAGVAGFRADEAAEVLEVHPIRTQVRGQDRAGCGGVHGQVALQVGAADLAGGVGELHRSRLVVQVAGDAVGGGLGKGDAGQGRQLLHVRAGQLQLEVGAGEGEGVLDRAGQGHLGGAVRDLQVDRVGGFVAEGEQGAAGELGGDGLVGVGALGGGDDLAGLPGLVAFAVLRPR